MAVTTLVATVDWEGMTLKDKNLKALQKFNEEHPEVPLTHFIILNTLVRNYPLLVGGFSCYTPLKQRSLAA